MKFFIRNGLYLLILAFIFSTSIFAVPTYNQYDPFIIHTYRGVNTFKHKIDGKYNLNLNLSPFYQNASGSRNAQGAKSAEGDIFGAWNVFGLFYGVENNQIKAAPTSKPFILEQAAGGTNPWIPNSATRGYYPKLSAAWRVLDDKDEGGGTINYDNTNFVLNYTDPDNYDSTIYSVYLPITRIDYEKFGLRLDLNFECKSGLGINVKSGLVDYRQTPKFGNASGFDPTYPIPVEPPIPPDPDYIYAYLRREEVMKDIFNEVGLNTDQHQETTLEDTFLQLYYKSCYKVYDEDDELQVSLIPYIAAGLWVPTGKEENPDSAFSLPTGNNGFWGITADGAFNFDLPGSIQFGFGGGIAYFFDRNLQDQRIANHELQQGVFPWKADIRKEPGLIWHLDASMYAPKFLDHFSISLDFVYLRHNSDKITMQESDVARNAYFVPSVNEENSKWYATILQGGLEYEFNNGLQLGFGFQAHLSGRNVYRDNTVMGTISFVF